MPPDTCQTARTPCRCAIDHNFDVAPRRARVTPSHSPRSANDGYSTRESDLKFFQNPRTSTNASWLDFFLGVEAVVCRVATQPCDAIQETTKAAAFLQIPAMYPVRTAFFADEYGSATVPSLAEAERSWVALKQRLPPNRSRIAGDRRLPAPYLSRPEREAPATRRGGALWRHAANLI